MPDEPAAATPNDTGGGDNQADDAPQCRICLDGEDPELGRLIRPCLCKGSVSYVHVKCLHRWRNSSTSNSAFYRCPQCGYHYRFARTQVAGIASNPIAVGLLSGVAFTLLLFLSSFVTTWLISGTGEDSYVFVYPWETFREVIRTAVCVLADTGCDEPRLLKARGGKLRYPAPRRPPTLLGRFARRLLLGLPTVGAGSLLNLLWSLPFPITHWLRVRLRRSGRNASDLMTLVLLTAVVIGAARALWKVYQLTERTVKRLLLRAEDAILEVS
ncbi:E3 ubiquitin-protein ligase MARCH [Phanerochaete sordida]|uniref:E3 ubiquitin-protein ligase MARCH n=1 Tax=Phanerochaete sordida TaxID=48140 RepID=A0A9P3G4F8_9APHY|nr:E3 ubiquitin-protein ligase MARCH [Phanerochaete sordida]